MNKNLIPLRNCFCMSLVYMCHICVVFMCTPICACVRVNACVSIWVWTEVDNGHLPQSLHVIVSCALLKPE